MGPSRALVHFEGKVMQYWKLQIRCLRSVFQACLGQEQVSILSISVVRCRSVRCWMPQRFLQLLDTVFAGSPYLVVDVRLQTLGASEAHGHQARMLMLLFTD